jgi:CcmD family protein
MDPILAEIYSTVLEAAPFVIAAYALIWVCVFAYVFVVTTRLKRTEQRMQLLEELLVARADGVDTYEHEANTASLIS